jgi:hypothetical protein
MPHPTAVGSTVKISLELEIIDIIKIFQMKLIFSRGKVIIFQKL